MPLRFVIARESGDYSLHLAEPEESIEDTQEKMRALLGEAAQLVSVCEFPEDGVEYAECGSDPTFVINRVMEITANGDHSFRTELLHLLNFVLSIAWSTCLVTQLALSSFVQHRVSHSIDLSR